MPSVSVLPPHNHPETSHGAVSVSKPEWKFSAANEAHHRGSFCFGGFHADRIHTCFSSSRKWSQNARFTLGLAPGARTAQQTLEMLKEPQHMINLNSRHTYLTSAHSLPRWKQGCPKTPQQVVQPHQDGASTRHAGGGASARWRPVCTQGRLCAEHGAACTQRSPSVMGWRGPEERTTAAESVAPAQC